MICLMISWMMEVTTTMRISTFFYTIKQGIVNIWKNKLFSLASIATMTACIFLFGLFYMIVVNFQSMVKDAESGVAVTVLYHIMTLSQQMKHGKASRKFTLREMKRRLQVLPAITRWQIPRAMPST